MTLEQECLRSGFLPSMETDTLGKKAVAEMLKTAPPELQKVLTLRQQLAKFSVKKYQAMETAVCADGRARGMFQFYGANRTGRWAGRIIQMPDWGGVGIYSTFTHVDVREVRSDWTG